MTLMNTGIAISVKLAKTLFTDKIFPLTLHRFLVKFLTFAQQLSSHFPVLQISVNLEVCHSLPSPDAKYSFTRLPSKLSPTTGKCVSSV